MKDTWTSECRMEVKRSIHLRLTNGAEMHRMAVVKQKIVVRTSAMLICLPVGVNDEFELITAQNRINPQWTKDVRGVACGLYVPPLVTEPDRGGHQK